MATGSAIRRVSCSASRFLPRVDSKQIHTRARNMPSYLYHHSHHHHCRHPPVLLSDVACINRRADSGSATAFHICRRGFFTKWSSTSSSSSSSTSSSRKDNEPSSKDADGRLEEEDEESIIPKTDEKGQPLSNWKRMKIMMKAYGYVIIPVHWVIAPVWFGAFYYTIKMGVDIGPFLKMVGVSDHHIETLRSSKASTALMAYALYKIFTPLRYTVTLGATEVTIRRLRKMGYMKPTPPKEKTYRESFKETVGEMKDKISDMRDSRNPGDR